MESTVEDPSETMVPSTSIQDTMMRDVSNTETESTNAMETTDCVGSCSANEKDTPQKEADSPTVTFQNQSAAANSPESTATTSCDGVPYCRDELKPVVGKKFASLQQAIEFYSSYATTCGFTMRKEGEKRNEKGLPSYKTLVCNKHGEGKAKGKIKKREVTRQGCKACVAFKMVEKGEYMVYKFVEAHNHHMMTPTTMVHLKSGRELNVVHKKMIIDNSRVNHGPVKTFRMFKEYVKGYNNIGASLQDFKNFSRDVKKFLKEYDAQMMIETFIQKRAMCPSFYFDFDVDEDQKLTKLFWADPISIKNYALYGDSCSFDTTFDFNKYKMVFAPFTGVDNHKKCVTFGAGLISKEDADSFSWLFENFLKAVGGCYPTTLITDQCLGIKAGVDKVFSDKTHHRYCMWHITKKMPEKVGALVSRDTDFLKEISAIIWGDEVEIEEFEAEWKNIVDKYDLSDNEWLSQIFDMRKSWIPSYFRDTYLGGLLRTTSRSESENSFFSNFTNPQLSLVEFYMRFQSAMDAQRWKNSKLTADSKNSSPVISTPLLMEKEASEFYTPALFYEFQEELTACCFNCGLHSMRTNENVEMITVNDRQRKKLYEVAYHENEISCSCKRFERFGMLCRHALWVLKDRGFQEIPSEYMLSRWSKRAMCRPIFNVVGTTLLDDCASVDTRQQKVGELWSELFTSVSLVENDEEKTEELLALLHSFNEQLLLDSKKKAKGKGKKAEIETLIGSKIPVEAHVLPPNIAKNKGSGKRMMTDKEKATQEHQKPLRKCRACGEMANHDSRNCDKSRQSKKKKRAVDVESD